MLIRNQRFVIALSCIVLGVTGWVMLPQRSEAQPANPKAQGPRPRAVGKADPIHSVDANRNANTKSVAEARKDGKHHERLSPLVAPAAFDKAKFEANPQAYLDVVEPGRVWQTAAPGAGVKHLHSKGSERLKVAVGGNVDLAVRGTPSAPVTFTAFDGGVFENQLASITVRADDKGEAHATFTATPGTIDDVNVIAGSPMASSQARFVVKVNPAK